MHEEIDKKVNAFKNRCYYHVIEGGLCLGNGEIVVNAAASLFKASLEEIASFAKEATLNEVREKIENFAVMKGAVIELLEEKDEQSRITNRLNENLEMGYRQACRDILQTLSK